MRGERLEELEKFKEHRARKHLPCHGFIDENHERGYGGVETKAFQIICDFFDRGVKRLELSRSGLGILDLRVEPYSIEKLFVSAFGCKPLVEFDMAGFIDEQSPYTPKETINSFDIF